MDERVLRLLITARQQTDAAFRHVSQNARQLQSTLHAVDRAAGTAFRKAGSEASGFGMAVQKASDLAGRGLSVVTGALKGVLGSVMDLAQNILGTLVNAFQQLISVAAKATAVVGGALVAGMVAVGKTGVDMNISLQSAQVGLTSITGSAQKAAQFIKELRETARTTAPTFKELLPIGQSLAAVYGPAGLGKAIATIKAFDAAGKVLAGGDRNATSRALLQFRQLAASKTVQGDELRLIEENLPGAGIRQAISAAFGTSEGKELNKLGVTGMQAADVIVAAMQKKFGASTGALANSIPILFSGIQDTMNDMTASITESFTGSLGRGLQAFSAAFLKLAGNKKVIAALAVPFDLLGKFIERAAAALPSFVSWLEQVLTKENVVAILSQVAGWVQTIFSEVGRLVGALSGGKGPAGLLQTFGEVAGKALDIAYRSFNAVIAVIQYLGKNSDKVWQLVRKGIDFAIAGIEVLVGALAILVGAKMLGGLAQVASLLGVIGGGTAGATAAAAAAGKQGGGVGGIPIVAALKGPSGFSDPAMGKNIVDWWRQRFGGGGKAGSAAGVRAGGVASGAGAAGAAMGVQFDGIAGGAQRLGQSILGTAGGLPGAAFGALPKELQNLLTGAQQAGANAYQSRGLTDLIAAANRRSAGVAGSLNGMLGPGGAMQPAGAPAGTPGGGYGYPYPVGSLGGYQAPLPRINAPRNAPGTWDRVNVQVNVGMIASPEAIARAAAEKAAQAVYERTLRQMRDAVP